MCGSQIEALLVLTAIVKPTGTSNDGKTNVKFMNNKKSHFAILYCPCGGTELQEGHQTVEGEEGDG